ncbi:hypothetical protein Bca52824_095974 [Brassica carinata]|uniref:Ubiquitin-like protease family profile domain-containing protein n=1 Tax=Brassica carinata TaxID=52824 RepID=A0A8X7P1H9_BRACI|nr:hypothetical protein Bca52824_095974 [Brassica carinata]
MRLSHTRRFVHRNFLDDPRLAQNPLTILICADAVAWRMIRLTISFAITPRRNAFVGRGTLHTDEEPTGPCADATHLPKFDRSAATDTIYCPHPVQGSFMCSAPVVCVTTRGTVYLPLWRGGRLPSGMGENKPATAIGLSEVRSCHPPRGAKFDSKAKEGDRLDTTNLSLLVRTTDLSVEAQASVDADERYDSCKEDISADTRCKKPELISCRGGRGLQGKVCRWRRRTLLCLRSSNSCRKHRFDFPDQYRHSSTIGSFDMVSLEMVDRRDGMMLLMDTPLIFITTKGGDCGPCAAKFIEMHAAGLGTEEMSRITHNDIDNFESSMQWTAMKNSLEKLSFLQNLLDFIDLVTECAMLAAKVIESFDHIHLKLKWTKATNLGLGSNFIL